MVWGSPINIHLFHSYPIDSPFISHKFLISKRSTALHKKISGISKASALKAVQGIKEHHGETVNRKQPPCCCGGSTIAGQCHP